SGLGCKGAVLAALLWSAPPVNATAKVPDGIGGPYYDIRMVVLGDSLADGLWGSLRRAFARCNRIELVRLTKVSDGLAGTDAEAWLDRYARATPIVEGATAAEIVIVQVGANDITFLRDGTTRIVFGSPEWAPGYASRARRLAEGLTDQASAVIWLGLPIVGSARLQPHYREISNLLRGALSGTGAAFVDIHELTKFGSETFVMNARHDGRVVQMRATDRIHFTAVGYDRVLEWIAGDLIRVLAEIERSAAFQDVELQ
ncbi:MAG: DUF459 domain-containing protein, partial [Boseongicola sp. SB0677_bin_26]|nr:DUF459 domain-containing protein [Boseongicola sp. SB0677_bin_26]